MSATMEIGFTLRPVTKAAANKPRAAYPAERGSDARLGLLLLALSGSVSVTGLYWAGTWVASLFA